MNKTWLFSRKIDLILFSAPVILAFALQYLFDAVHFDFFESIYPYYLIFIISDGAHVYMSYFLGHIDKQELLSNKTKYLLFPILACSIVYFFSAYDKQLWIKVFSTYTIYHFIKQQNAWFFICASKVSRSSKEIWLDKFAIWSSTWGITVLSLSNGIYYGWFSPNDLPKLPTFLYAPTLGLMIICIFTYICYYTLKSVKTKQIHWAKHHLLLLALICWYMFRLSPDKKHTFASLFIMLFHHAAPYIYLCYKYIKTTTLPKMIKNKRLNINYTYVSISFYIICMLLAFFQINRLAHRDYFFGFNEEKLTLGRIEHCIWIGFSLYHYYFDGFFWKRKNNTNLKNIFN